ncbi:MAG: hypothetical protein BRC34_06515 [Cyanobacteria bacterium QH_1_48_107]|nr:MAG: hypothetical protein BRC34_06515 [Cyanobacteria bacterium QH_1_48_107]PSO71774.1 MAG: hypothetical protein BRC42_07090 [Cyanobacteria bacterium QS_1_48_34]
MDIQRKSGKVKRLAFALPVRELRVGQPRTSWYKHQSAALAGPFLARSIATPSIESTIHFRPQRPGQGRFCNEEAQQSQNCDYQFVRKIVKCIRGLHIAVGVARNSG